MARKMDIDYNQHKFEFTRSWFRNRNLATFREYIYPHWHDKPIIYLEIGVFEGMSLVWMMQKVLTHEKSRAVGIDPWLMTSKLNGEEMEKVGDRATFNVSPWCYFMDSSRQDRKCYLLQSNSVEVLMRMNKRGGFAGIKKGTVDICMIDGDHNSGGVLDDARLVYPLMKQGGWMLFDDVENDRPKEDHVRQGVDMYLKEAKGLKSIWKHRYVECYEKIST